MNKMDSNLMNKILDPTRKIPIILNTNKKRIE